MVRSFKFQLSNYHMYCSQICHDILWLLKSDDILWWYTLCAILWWYSLIVILWRYSLMFVNSESWLMISFLFLWENKPVKILWSMIWISNHESQFSSLILISILCYYFTLYACWYHWDSITSHILIISETD